MDCSMFVSKRDGSIELFDVTKIERCVAEVVNEETAEKVAEEVMREVSNKDETRVTSEEINQLVLKRLEGSAATKFKERGNERQAAREREGHVFKCLREITALDSDSDIALRENANINSVTAMGQMLKAGSEVMKHYYLNEVIAPEFAEAHRNGDIHIHDLDFYGMTTTCLQIDLSRLFKEGFTTGHGTIRSPQSIRNYWSLLCIVIQANQNEQHGGQSIPNLEYDLAPGVAKSFARILANIVIDDHGLRGKYDTRAAKRFRDEVMEKIYPEHSTLMDAYAIHEMSCILRDKFGFEPSKSEIESATLQVVDECLQGAEACVHNLCTMNSRAGSQVPFSSINYGTGTSPEQRMVIACILQALENGLGKGETQIFPIHIFRVKDGINYKPGDPNYDLFRKAIQVTARRLFPNFEFIDAPFNLQYYVEGDPDTLVATMGCVAADSRVTVKFDGGTEKEMPIGNLYNVTRGCRRYPLRVKGQAEYYRIEDGAIEIRDRDRFVRVKTVLRNNDVSGWKEVGLDNGTSLVATLDHPLPVRGRGRTFVKDLHIGDKVELGGEEGGITKVVSLMDRTDMDGARSYDVETESDRFDVNGLNSHNCRTRVMGNVNGPQTTSGRGNLSFTSINLPRLALKAKGDIGEFFEYLDYTLDMCVRQLLERFKIQCSRKVLNFPFMFGNHLYMNSDHLAENSTLFDALKNGTLSVGFVGLAEALVALIGKHHGESEEAQKLGLQIVEYMRDAMDAATEAHHLNFTLLATPAESTAGTLLQKDRRDYGIVSGVTDKEYYTNSNHVPVWYNISAKDKIAIEAPYHALCNAGHICYVEYDGDPKQNLEAVERIVRWMKEFNVGYGAINHPVDTCRVCGYTGIINDSCPKCGNDDQKQIKRLRRVTGYLVGDRDSRFNAGKIAEERDRVKHSLG